MRRAPLWFLAGVLATLAIELAAWPLWHRADPIADEAPEPLSSMPLADVNAALEGGGDNGDSSADAAAASTGADSSTASASAAGAAAAAGSMQSAVARLEARLSGTGGSTADWDLLAQSYDFMGRHEDAALARKHQLPPSVAPSAPAR